MTRSALPLLSVAILTLSLMVSAVPAPSAPVLTLVMAQKMIEGCTNLTATAKMPPLSVVVIDVSGTLLAFQRQDGASPVSADVAVQKARSALRARASTRVIGTLASQDAATRDALVALGILGVPGGIPFPAGAAVPVGAVGVSGASPDVDERCATAAVAVMGGLTG